MQATSDLYKQIISDTSYKTECRLAIGTKDTPIAGMDTFVYGNEMHSINTVKRLFPTENGEEGGNFPTAGNCTCATIDVEMFLPDFTIPRQAKLVPQVRVTNSAGTKVSEWLSKGVFFIDTREINGDDGSRKRIYITGYDALRKANQDYPSSKLDWPAKDIDVVNEIASYIGVAVDSRTTAIMTKGFSVQYPGTEYTCWETLSYIAAMYTGSFIMSDIGELRLVQFFDLPKTTNYLIDNNGYAITFGGVRILV